MDIEATYRRFFPVLRQHCRRLAGAGHWSDDIAQESFLRLLSGPRLSTERETLAWLYRISSNLVVDRLRHTARRPVEPEELAPPTASTSEISMALRHTVRRLSTVLDSQTLQAGLLARANGLTQVELAEILGVSERTARRRLADFDHAAQSLKLECANG